jgi:hypothetical protein
MEEQRLRSHHHNANDSQEHIVSKKIADAVLYKVSLHLWEWILTQQKRPLLLFDGGAITLLVLSF